MWTLSSKGSMKPESEKPNNILVFLQLMVEASKDTPMQLLDKAWLSQVRKWCHWSQTSWCTLKWSWLSSQWKDRRKQTSSSWKESICWSHRPKTTSLRFSTHQRHNFVFHRQPCASNSERIAFMKLNFGKSKARMEAWLRSLTTFQCSRMTTLSWDKI